MGDDDEDDSLRRKSRPRGMMRGSIWRLGLSES